MGLYTNGVMATGGVTSTVLKALAEIQMVAADIVSVTTCTDNATFYEPALQVRLTSNAVYKRYVALKVSAQSNTAGTISIELRNVTAGTSGTAVTVVIAGGQENVEKAIAATTVTAQATTLADVFTIRVKHSVNGATVTLNSGGMMEADVLLNINATGAKQLTAATIPYWISSLKYLMLAGLSTASYTAQPYTTTYIGGTSITTNMGSASSTLNSSITITLPYKVYANNTGAITWNVTPLVGELLGGCAYALSFDNI